MYLKQITVYACDAAHGNLSFNIGLWHRHKSWQKIQADNRSKMYVGNIGRHAEKKCATGPRHTKNDSISPWVKLWTQSSRRGAASLSLRATERKGTHPFLLNTRPSMSTQERIWLTKYTNIQCTSSVHPAAKKHFLLSTQKSKWKRPCAIKRIS